MTDLSSTVKNRETVSLWSLFWSFLKIGSTAFGGFMALVSVVQSHLVEKRKLLTNEEIMDGVSLASMLPGPVAVNVVTYAGYRLHGKLGALVCFTAVILPSFLLILGLSYTYFKYGNLPTVAHIFNGIVPAVSAIIITAAYNLSKNAIKSTMQYLIALFSLLILVFIGGFYTTISLIVMAGLYGILIYKKQLSNEIKFVEKIPTTPDQKKQTRINILLGMFFMSSFIMLLLKYQTLLSIKLLTIFSGMSLMLFGGGFVFIPMIQEVIVDSYGWLTVSEFTDGIALGQITPGPIVISATFIGYKVAGVLGSATATIGAFVPSAILMVICTQYLDSIKNSYLMQAALKSIRACVIGMIVAAAYVISLTAETNFISLGIFASVLLLSLKFKIETVYLIPLSGLAGFIFY